jgi:CHAD domain-containing protein
MPPVADIIEVEWQFAALDLRAVLQWLESAAVPGFTVTPGKTKQLDDPYFDTADWRVHRAGFTCRTRRKSDGVELTLKSMASSVDAMRSRRELTEPLPGDCDSNPAAATGQCGEILRLVAGRHALRPIFNLQTDRRTFALADETGVIGEIAVDDTSIPIGEDEPVRLSRVEVEVDALAVARARRFVDVLVATTGLSPAGTSKFEAALAATGQQVILPNADLGPTTVAAQMPAGEVAYAIMRKQFHAMLTNEPGTRLGDDIEALHDMRVATRRLRAAMSAFEPFLSPRMQPFREQLGWVAGALGEVRDLDVQLERMEEWRAGFALPQAQALDAVEALLAARRAIARKRMLAVLDSRRYESLAQRFAAALRRGPARSFLPGQQPILAVAPELVERRYRKLIKAGDAIRKSSAAADYHLLRIDAKKLRYALEFVGPIYGKPATDFSTRVTALQDVLGLHQDADVADHMLHEMAAANARKLGVPSLLAMGAIADRYRRHAEELRAQFPAVYRPLAGEEWRKLQKLMVSRKPRA